MQRAKKHDIYQKEVDPDNELLLWEEWIKIRKDEATKLGQQLNIVPVDLAMNLLEKVREDKERKTVLEQAQVDKKPTVRGALWEQPQRLKQVCEYEPVYEVHRTPAEMGRPSVIEHVGVPRYIQVTEKDMAGDPERIICSKLDLNYKKYREKRELDLKVNIKKIDPFRPSTSGLMIKGSKPQTPPKKMPPLPVISIIEPTGPSEGVLRSVYALRMNNTVIYKDIPDQTLTYLKNIQNSSWHETCTTWNYYFNTPVKRAGRSKLFLQNLGTVTLRYCWKKIKKPIPFIPEDIYEQVFFFNKNEDVLSPGQSRELFFTFVSDRPGIYSEFWEFNLCNICFFDTLADKLVVNLYADSVENIEGIRRKVDIIKSKIDRKTIDNIVTNLLDDIVNKATVIEPQIYSYNNRFLEAEIFVMNNPVCFYHQTEVSKMKEIYTEMVPGEIWNLSITSWRETMMEKEYEERMKYYEMLRNSHTELLKPWYEGDDLLKQKYRMVKLLLGQMADKLDNEYERLMVYYCPISEPPPTPDTTSKSQLKVNPRTSLDALTEQKISNIFYIHAYEHVAAAIELCSGVLSSLDLNRWIEFDFCRW